MLQCGTSFIIFYRPKRREFRTLTWQTGACRDIKKYSYNTYLHHSRIIPHHFNGDSIICDCFSMHLSYFTIFYHWLLVILYYLTLFYIILILYYIILCYIMLYYIILHYACDWCDWSVFITYIVISAIGGRGLTAATRQRCAASLRRTGFAVLRGASLFAETELQAAQRTATAELRRVQKATEEPRKSGEFGVSPREHQGKTMKSHGETIGKIVDLVFQLVEQGKSKEREREI